MPVRAPYPVRDSTYELLDYIERRLQFQQVQPLWLGGAPGSPGSIAPPGGYIGMLPQNRVQWAPEDEYSVGSSSGSSLVDNLAHDRYRLTEYMRQLAYPHSEGSSISAGSWPSWGSGAWIVGFSPGSPPGVTTVQEAIQRIWDEIGGGIAFLYTWTTFTFTVEGDLEVATGKIRLSAPGHMTIVEVQATVDTPAAGQDILIDVKLNGTTIFGANKLTILAGANSGVATPPPTSLNKDDYLTMDIIQRGLTTPGSDLAVHIRCKQYMHKD